MKVTPTPNNHAKCAQNFNPQTNISPYYSSTLSYKTTMIVIAYISCSHSEHEKQFLLSQNKNCWRQISRILFYYLFSLSIQLHNKAAPQHYLDRIPAYFKNPTIVCNTHIKERKKIIKIVMKFSKRNE